MYAKNEKLKGFKCSEIIPGTVFELQTADLLSKPRAPFFRTSDRATQAFGQVCQNVPVRFDLDEQFVANWPSGSPA